ncbi:TetR family transcriptional regulator [Diaphorobacter ruginosibacter]|uniref:TetR family transcriptional regulator n=1 Tax=Diaphorobacter ruginosibacter TaxID=1715720 RepID=A0A7G9RKQ6_9BURK|nr:TetR family transcriptional regulator [Diaphorobacter ruginosibacter]QNN56181.1 TetR family transcriptional regulator [Diaphorobacter ruginosibacter]
MTTRSKISNSSNGTAARKPGVRELAAQATRDSLLRAAIKVFSKSGFDGGSIEQISKAAKSYDRMIYYYFGSKAGLFLAVIEEIYSRFNQAEATLTLDMQQPGQSLEIIVKFIIRYYREHPEFVTLLNEENLHRGKHLAKSKNKGAHSSPAIGILDRVLASGVQQGLFRADISARDLYLMIAAMGYFYQSNRFTLASFLGESLDTPDALAHWESFAIESVLRTTAVAAAALPGTSAATPIKRAAPTRRS